MKHVHWVSGFAWVVLSVCSSASAQADALTDAIGTGDASAVAKAISAGTDLNRVNENGAVPLELALLHPEVVAMLLDKGANICAKTNVKEKSERVLDYARRVGGNIGLDNTQRAAMKESLEMLESQKCAGKNDSSKIAAIQKKYTDLASEKTVIPVPGNPSDMPPIVSAVRLSKLDKVKELLDSGVDPNFVWSKSALIHMAMPVPGATSGSDAVLSLLLERKADPNLHMATRGVTPLHLLAEDGPTSLGKILLDRGAHVDSRDSENYETPLHIAAKKGNTEMVELLLQNGAYVNARNRFGKTPLCGANEA